MKPICRVLFATILPLLLIAGCTDSMEKLMTAAQKGDVQAVETQLEEGTPVDTPDPTGSTALLYAAGKGHTELVAFLISRGADVNVKDNEGFMPLHAAVGAGDPETVRLLLENDADADATFRGISPLAVAERKGNEEIVAMLRKTLGIAEPAPEPEPEPAPEPAPDATTEAEEGAVQADSPEESGSTE
jgi:ankyrin repeat protein